MSSNKVNIRLGWTERYMADEPKVCSSCIEAIREENIYEDGSEAIMAIEIGADIDDHNCEGYFLYSKEDITVSYLCECICS